MGLEVRGPPATASPARGGGVRGAGPGKLVPRDHDCPAELSTVWQAGLSRSPGRALGGEARPGGRRWVPAGGTRRRFRRGKGAQGGRTRARAACSGSPLCGDAARGPRVAPGSALKGSARLRLDRGGWDARLRARHGQGQGQGHGPGHGHGGALAPKLSAKAP